MEDEQVLPVLLVVTVTPPAAFPLGSPPLFHPTQCWKMESFFQFSQLFSPRGACAAFTEPEPRTDTRELSRCVEEPRRWKEPRRPAPALKELRRPRACSCGRGLLMVTLPCDIRRLAFSHFTDSRSFFLRRKTRMYRRRQRCSSTMGPKVRTARPASSSRCENEEGTPPSATMNTSTSWNPSAKPGCWVMMSTRNLVYSRVGAGPAPSGLSRS
mmetsp:Transcript_28823/g.45432  ORF Transcript_28823/g.45432 Transcript_28823/m.45432 type:complete len:213 (+) Transcript_28823:591-1229(+)